MNTPVRIIALSLLPMLSVGLAKANDLSVYPGKGQSQEQLEKDKFEC